VRRDQEQRGATGGFPVGRTVLLRGGHNLLSELMTGKEQEKNSAAVRPDT